MSRPRTPTVCGMQLNALFARNLWEQLQRAAKLAEARTSEARYAPDAFDIDSLPIRLTKAYPGVRDVQAIDLVVGHVTDVRGGFGVQRWGPEGWQRWLKGLERGEVPMELLDQIPDWTKRDPLDLAKRIALWSRWRNTPYHQLSGANGDVVDNRRLHSRTRASSAGNDGVAWAMDCGHTEHLSDDDVRTGQHGLDRLVRRLREAGNTKPLRYAPHRAFDPDRRRDTDRIVHLSIVKPAVERINRDDPYGFRIDYDIALAGGRPISTRDDPEAHFDDRGRRVRAA